MQLSVFRVGNNLADSSDAPWSDEFEIVLSPPPVLELDTSESAAMLDRPTSEVLHVKVIREIKPGVTQTAHLHFTIGLNKQDQLFGEVSIVDPQESGSMKWPPLATDQQEMDPNEYKLLQMMIHHYADLDVRTATKEELMRLGRDLGAVVTDWQPSENPVERQDLSDDGDVV